MPPVQKAVAGKDRRLDHNANRKVKGQANATSSNRKATVGKPEPPAEGTNSSARKGTDADTKTVGDAPAKEGAQIPTEQQKDVSQDATGSSDLSQKLLTHSRRGDWLAVDALLKHVEKGDFNQDIPDEILNGYPPKPVETGQKGWTTLKKKKDLIIAKETESLGIEPTTAFASIYDLNHWMMRKMKMTEEPSEELPLLPKLATDSESSLQRKIPNWTVKTTGWTPLMYAIRDNRVPIAERLLSLGANPNARAADGLTALHIAAAQTREDSLRLLLSRKADPGIVGGPKKHLPLHVISSRPTGAAIAPLQHLLRACNKEMRLQPDLDGNIPLFLAIESGNHGVCRDLLSSHAKDQLSYHHPTNGDTAIHMATRKHDTDLMRFFIEMGSNANVQNGEGQTPLHLASMEGDEAVIKLLHQANADPNIMDKQDRTPLHLATERGQVKIVDILTDKFRASVYERTKDGSTLMHIASAAGHPGTALLFMRKGVPLHMPNKAGAKCIHMAAMRGHVEVVRTLIQRGEQVDATTNDNYTALHIAVLSNQPQVVETLLGFGANVQVKAGKNEESPLHIAARVPDGEKCAELLLKSGANVNALEEHGETPMHVAARHGHLKAVQLMLEDGANPGLQSEVGETTLHIAVRQCHYLVTQALLRHWSKRTSKEKVVALVNQQNREGETAVHYAAANTSKQAHYENEDRDLMRLLLQYGGDSLQETNKTKETPVHYASRAGNAIILQEMISHLNPAMGQLACNRQAANGWSPLMFACYHGHPDVVRLLLNNSARVDVFDDNGKAALHLAAELGHEDVLDILLEHKAFVNVRSKVGMTPLHLAASNGFNSIVRQLVTDHGAVLDAMTLTKQTPLHLAAENGQLEVCNTLLDMKADANATDNHDQTPLHLAAENDHSEVVKLFLRHKPELVSVANKNGFTCAHIAAMKGSVGVIKELMKFDKDVVTTARIKTTGSTALHLAAEGGHADVVKALLEAGAKATDENSEGYTALHLAARHGHVQVLQALKSAVSWKITSRKTGLTALHVAASYGQTDFVREMLTQVPAAIRSEKPIIDLGDDHGVTPLHLAVEFGHEAVVRMLLNSSGVQVDTPTLLQGRLPMHLAAKGGHLAVAGLLLSRSTEQLHATERQGRTPLHLAASNGHRDMVGLLLGQGAEINATDNKGWTPLHYTARNGYLEVVKLLVESGANPNAVSKDSMTPLGCASQAGHYEVMNYLMKKDHDTFTLMDDKSFLIDLMACGKLHENKPIEEFVLVSAAPIDTAVKMARTYQLLSLREKDRAHDLELASEFCDTIATDLLSITASNNNAGAQLLQSLDAKNTPFLDVLIELQRKDVVAHPAVQKYLSEMWMGNLNWPAGRMILLFFAFILCPPIWIAVSFPTHRLSNVPIIKFMSYLVSHIFFILVLCFTTVNPWVPLWHSTSMLPRVHEWLLLLWLIGIFIADLTNPRDRDGLGAIKIVVLAFSFIGICVHFIGFFFSDEYSRLIVLYCRNQLFAVSLLLSFLEFLNFLSFHYLFGPWAVIIRDLMKDLLRFLAILAIFLTGFSLHVCAVYQPVFRPPDNGNVTLPEFVQDFQSPVSTFEMLFFALFGLVEPDLMPPMHSSPPFSKVIMKVVFGVYMMVTVVVLINLLIAMMSNTYQRIQAQSDTEWKFGRAKLIRNMNRTSPCPSPLNLVSVIPEAIYKRWKQRKAMKKEAARVQNQVKRNMMGSRPSIIVPKAWMRRSMQNNSQVVPIGLSDMPDEPKPITEVVHWPAIVAKYYELKGATASNPRTSQDK